MTTTKSRPWNLACRFVLAALIVIIFSPAPVTAAPPQRTRVTHTMFVWLRNPNNMKERTQVVQAAKWLLSIPGVTSVSVGSAIPTRTFGTDTSYDVAIVIGLEDRDTLAMLPNFPMYQNSMKVIGSLLVKFVMYDFQNW